MKRKEQNFTQDTGFMPQGGYPQGSYPAGGTGYQGYPSPQGQQAPAGYTQPQGYPQTQGYPRQGGYFQNQNIPQMPGTAGARSYQTPQVAGGQTAPGTAEPAYIGQGSFAQTGYQPQAYGQGQTQPGYQAAQPYPQQTGYQPNPAGTTPGYPYPGSQAPAGSYIPQTPYSQGYVTPGYQAQAQAGYQAQTGYTQGYGAYTQMGRAPQTPVNPMQGPGGQVPLNGGGYVPQPVPVRKKPFEMTDAYLLILCAVLLVLFALGMFVPGLGGIKWLFLALAAGAIGLFWFKPMIASNKRLCFSIVFGMLMLVTVIGLVTGGAGDTGADRTNNQQTVNTGAASVSQENNGAQQAAQQQAVPVTPAPEETQEVDPEEQKISNRLREFFEYWTNNDIDKMLNLCSPKWKANTENPRNSLFNLLSNRKPTDMSKVYPESISGTSQDTSRTITLSAEMDRNDGKEPVQYRIGVIMKYEYDDQWYVDPQSLKSNEPVVTKDPNETPTPEPTPKPETSASTILYYNPDGGKSYHRDPNCPSTSSKYLPFKGQFTYGELLAGQHDDLTPCSRCAAPWKGEGQ
ncbi:hypothetical protein [Aristaeella lactis]|uniref:Uncharacterized protein n=1 Tax=Aristaeella lactis TaxID=3046383 RepID=A0AC61PJ17_9FIRM|nr:hypothetical protein [Aristaeella lactis]QUA53968.1 hypothetical protein JYE50_04915 [Aristaeella lactis]SMC41733.1 hypothetical protein SAMN06297397_0780 [Aristaeella lactis]